MSLSLIVLGGAPPSTTLLQKYARTADISIAADSGLACFEKAGILADIAVGDFDSFTKDPAQFAKTVISAPEQDASDFQKALRSVSAHESGDEIVILGGTGLRVDHFLTNLLVVAEKWARAKISFKDDQQEIFRVNAHCPLELNTLCKDQTVSLIPFTRAEGVTAIGLHWPLENAQMEPNGQLGQSNRANQSCISIHVKSGILYTVINHQI